MCLVSPQKISRPKDASSLFHKRNGKRYQLGIHVKKPYAIKNPANQKFNKKRD